MFIFYWFNLFSTDYRNGLGDGISLGLIALGLRYLIPYLLRRRNRFLFSRLTPDEFTGCFVVSGRHCCPVCAARGVKAPVAVVLDHSECVTPGCTFLCLKHDESYSHDIRTF